MSTKPDHTLEDPYRFCIHGIGRPYSCRICNRHTTSFHENVLRYQVYHFCGHGQPTSCGICGNSADAGRKPPVMTVPQEVTDAWEEEVKRARFTLSFV